jgi:hypothetical protein
MLLPFDNRYSINKEPSGRFDNEHNAILVWVVRFCDDFAETFQKPSEALKWATDQSDARRGTRQYHRNPTEAEIRFGHGATHYREFKFSECYNPETGNPKKRLKAKDDGLWYTYG